MQHYTARLRKDDYWDYTCGGFPVGYCCAYKEWTAEGLSRFGFDENDPQIKRAKTFKDKHHDCGHATRKEAEECYRQYLLDQGLQLMAKSNAQYKCRICDKWTEYFATTDTQLWSLCEEHNNREGVDKVFTSVGEMWIS